MGRNPEDNDAFAAQYLRLLDEERSHEQTVRRRHLLREAVLERILAEPAQRPVRLFSVAAAALLALLVIVTGLLPTESAATPEAGMDEASAAWLSEIEQAREGRVVADSSLLSKLVLRSFQE